jgi:hypothetical protein
LTVLSWTNPPSRGERGVPRRQGGILFPRELAQAHRDISSFGGRRESIAARDAEAGRGA